MRATKATFADLARRYSAHASAKRGGDLGLLPWGALPSRLEAVIRKRPLYGVSDVVPMREGFYILQRLPVTDS